jgi:dTDP-4-dehydrorhamnose reductase
MLGSTLKSFLKDAKFLNGRSELDLTNINEINHFFKNRVYDVIIHSAAYTNLSF